MENLDGYKSRLANLTALIEKLGKGELSIEELSEMERITRELHERSIILRYTTLRTHVMGKDEAEEVEAPVEEKEEPVKEEVAPEPEEEPSFDFAIFDEEDEPEEELVAPAPEPTPEPEPQPIEETPEPVFEAPAEEEEEPVVEESEETPEPQTTRSSFMDRLEQPDNSIAARFSESKIETLIGAFGLNQRLRYINDLFDGSSEVFSDAIKALDSQSNLDAAKQKIEQLAADYSWDPEEEVVVEFMSYISRRYA